MDTTSGSGRVPLLRSIAAFLTGPGMVAAVFGVWAQATPPRTAPITTLTEEDDHD